MADTSAVFRAIADFSRLRAEARRARKEMRGLSDESDTADEKLAETEGSASRAGRALAKTAAKAKAAQRGLDDAGDGADQAAGKLGRLARAARRADRALDKLDKSRIGRTLTGIASAAGRAASMLGKIGLGVGGIALLATAATAALGPVLSLAGAIAGLSGAVGVLPGLLGAVGVAVGTLKLAFSGMGDVMKAIAEGDAEAFNEAIKDMPPAMQAAARAMRSLAPAAKQLKRSVQQAFWSGLGPMIKNLGGTYLPILQRAMVRTATAANGLVKEVGRFLQQRSAVTDMRAGFGNIGDAMGNLKGLGTSVASIFTDLFTVSSEFLPGMADGLEDAADEFADFIGEARESGKLKEWIGAGIEQVKALGRVLGNVGSIFGAVFKAGSDAGAGFLITLDEITGSMADFLHSTEGQTALRHMFTAIGQAADVVIPILKQLVITLGDIVPVFIAIGQNLGPGVQAVIEGIGVAFTTARPGLEKLSAAFGEFLEAIGGSGPLIGQLVNGLADVLVPVLELLTTVIDAVTGAFNALPDPVQGVIGDLGGVAIAAGLALAAFVKLVKIGKGVVGMFATVSQAAIAMRTKFAGGKGAAAAGSVAGGGVIAAGGGKGKGGKFGKVGGALKKGGKVGAVLGLAALVFGVSSYDEASAQGSQTVQAYGKGAATQGPTTAQKIGQALMGFGPLAAMFGPWGWVVAAAAVAIGAIMTHWDTVGPWLSTKWGQITAWGKRQWGAFTTWLEQDLTHLVDFDTGKWSQLGSWLSGKWGDIDRWGKGVWGSFTRWWNGQTGQLFEWQRGIWGKIGSWLSNRWRDIDRWGRSVWSGFTNWLGGVWEGLAGVASSVASSIAGFFSSAWSAITSAARSMAGTVNGILDSIFGKANAVRRGVGAGISVGMTAGHMATGGWVGGAGRGDTQPRMLDPREFVVNPAAAAKWGPFLQLINSGSRPAGPSAGELVNQLGRTRGFNAGLAAATGGRATATAPFGSDGASVGPVQLTQHVHNPVAEKPSITLQRRVSRLARDGLLDAMGR